MPKWRTSIPDTLMICPRGLEKNRRNISDGPRAFIGEIQVRDILKFATLTLAHDQKAQACILISLSETLLLERSKRHSVERAASTKLRPVLSRK